ncbi:MAG TPA: prolipoprotein diacylglyceryl transferase family protein [Candidatus Sulfotelmatobacter sp.]
MLPFIYIGPWKFGMYGIMLATGLFAGFLLLRADLIRRRIRGNPYAIILVIGVTGFITSKLYKLIDTPSVYLIHPVLLLGPSGFTFYGAVMGGLVAAAFLARHYRIGFLPFLDAVSPGAALGYGIGRLGCFFAGDGDYGVPTSLPWGVSFPHGLVPTYARVHPTPIYEFVGAALISLYLWKRGCASVQLRIPPGRVFAEYLILTGVARFLVEFIRRNPRGWLGLTNAQQVAIISVTAGFLLLVMGITKSLSSSRPAV